MDGIKNFFSLLLYRVAERIARIELIESLVFARFRLEVFAISRENGQVAFDQVTPLLKSNLLHYKKQQHLFHFSLPIINIGVSQLMQSQLQKPREGFITVEIHRDKNSPFDLTMYV